MTTYLLITSDKPTELTAFVGPKKPVKGFDACHYVSAEQEFKQCHFEWQEAMETAKASRLPVVKHSTVDLYFVKNTKTHVDFIVLSGVQIELKPGEIVPLEGWEPEIVYQEAYLSGEGEVWKKCSIDRFNNIRHLDCKRQAYRLVRSESVKECKHQYPRSIERSNRVCGLCGHAEETSEIESPIEAKTQDKYPHLCVYTVYDNGLCICKYCGKQPGDNDQRPESHKTQESQKEELDGWHEVNIGGMVFKCKSGDDADYLLKAYIHYNEKRYIPSVNEDNWKMLHDAVAKENASKGLIIVQLRKDLEDVRKVCFDLGRVIEWSKNTPSFYSIDDKKDSF